MNVAEWFGSKTGSLHAEIRDGADSERKRSMNQWPSGHLKITLDDNWLSAVRAAAEHLDRMICKTAPTGPRSMGYHHRLKGKLGEAAVAVWLGLPKRVLLGDPLDEADVGSVEVKCCGRRDPRLVIGVQDRDRNQLDRPYVLTSPDWPIDRVTDLLDEPFFLGYREIWVVGWIVGKEVQKFPLENEGKEWRVQPNKLKNPEELKTWLRERA